MIVIVDYNIGNLNAIANMLKKIGSEGIISSDPRVVASAGKLILGGVGSFDSAMRNIHELQLHDIIDRKVREDGIPLLGICLGMQLMTQGSEEGEYEGFGWINAKTKLFSFNGDNEELKIPHMGWNEISIRKNLPIFDGLEVRSRFYFVHSYHVVCANEKEVLANCHYGYDFAAVIGNNKIIGTQFHPEKSHKFGLKLMENFVARY